MQYNSNTSTELSRYTFPVTGQDVRTIQIDGEPWFVARDVCEVLEIGNVSMAVSKLDDDEKQQVRVNISQTDVMRGRAPWFVNEFGLYTLILRSDKKEAKDFRRWVTHEVLPSIRKTGSYSVQQKEPSRKELAQWVIEAEERAELAEAQVKVLEPKAEAWQKLVANGGDYEMKDAADILAREFGMDIGRNRLFKFIRERGYVNHKDQPYKRYGEYFVSRMRSFEYGNTGKTGLTTQVRVTVAGLEFLYSQLKESQQKTVTR